MALRRGSFPTMITPFQPDGASIDYGMVDKLVEWFISSGCTGIFSPCQSSEMYFLSAKERLELASHVHQQIAGRVSHVAVGTYGGSVSEMSETVKAFSSVCDAVVVVTCFLDPDCTGDDALWQKNAEELLACTPGVALGLYECPLPYKRLLSPQLLAWCAVTGRFLFHKDTCCDQKQIRDKLKALQDAALVNDAAKVFNFYNANVETLLYSLKLGASGFSGISANFYPRLHVWLIENYAAQDDASIARAEEVQNLMTVFESTVVVNYPGSAKVYLEQAHGFPINAACRVSQFKFDEQQVLRLKALGSLAGLTTQRLEATS